MRHLDVLGVRVEMPTNTPIILLREREGARHLPIWIGAAEATAIAYAQQGVVPPRPLTHDLLVNTITALGDSLGSVRIDRIDEGVYYATLVLGSGIEIDSRASDAIALAIRAGADVYAPEDLLDSAGILLPEETDDEVEKFKEFLDHVSPEDFETRPDS
ncbi:MAG: bifunctional nuclease family protein [Actinobacteria bacterium]|nr:bifunctional nuclease family protein [Actinomycetota bacterium]